MKKLSVVDGMPFPIEAVTQKFAWIGRTGSGKTYGLKRFVEQMLYQQVQVVVLDTVGVWNGLRLGAKGFAIPVIGGLYGDIPLEASSGALVAEVTVDHGASLVLDTSQMTDGQRAKFCESFGRRLFELKKAAPSAMHIVLDEGQDIVPQNPNEGEKMMLHEWVRISKQGRAFGIGTSISTQRPQEVNKKALNQAECVMAFQLTGPHERKALEYWMVDRGVDTRLSDVLPKLEVGKPFVWSPQWLKVSKQGRILPIDSEDTSRTPEVGEKRVAARAMRPIDLSKLQSSMVTMAEESKQKDPTTLRARIKELEAQIAAGPQVAAPGTANLVRELLQDVDRNGGEYRSNLFDVQELIADFQETAIENLKSLATRLSNERAHLVERLTQLAAEQPTKPVKQAPVVERAQSTNKPSARYSSLFKELPSGAQQVLLAAFQYGEHGVPGSAIHLMTGHSSRTVANYLVLLSSHQAGALIERRPGRIHCTALGAACVPEDAPKFPTGKALVEYLQKTLPGSLAQVLREVAKAHPRTIGAAAIAADLKLSERTTANYLTDLSARGIVVRGKGFASLSPMLTREDA